MHTGMLTIDLHDFMYIIVYCYIGQTVIDAVVMIFAVGQFCMHV